MDDELDPQRVADAVATVPQARLRPDSVVGTHLPGHRIAGVRVHGAYAGLSTGGTMALLAETGVTPVCVFVVPRAQDRRVELPPGAEFHLARREVGELVLYALSKSPGSSALAAFVAP